MQSKQKPTPVKKLIVVTGGTKGIGKAIVERFASQGFNIATCARSEADLAVLKELIEHQYPGTEVYTMPADLSKKEETLAFGDFVLGLKMPIEVLVHNTGIFLPGKILEEPEGQFEQMMTTNLYSVYYLTRSLVPAMKEAQHGHLFNMASIASFMGYATGGSYAITKHAQLVLHRVLREELKEHGIRVTAVMPGPVFTASWEGVDIPQERFMKAEDIAEAVWSAYAMSERTVVEEIILRPQLGDL